MRTAFASNSATSGRQSVLKFVTTTIKQRGIPGFYAGVLPACYSIVPLMGLNFMAYDVLMGYMSDNDMKSSAFLAGTVGAVSGGVSKLSGEPKGASEASAGKHVSYAGRGYNALLSFRSNLPPFNPPPPLPVVLSVYPMDTVKKRLQKQGFSGASKAYTSALQCGAVIVKDEGARALYRGLGPTVVKSMAGTGLTFAFYNATRNLLVGTREEQELGW